MFNLLAEKNNDTSSDLNKTNSIEDVGYSEKLNLDRSSEEDSMEEDLPKGKQFDSKLQDVELKNKKENSEVPILKEESDSNYNIYSNHDQNIFRHEQQQWH
ncbi:hypothetical protein K1719_039865 [Acacia pycnantha]|nr:hypothetical protein K1719_039865 [Acacia pycnantha]